MKVSLYDLPQISYVFNAANRTVTFSGFSGVINLSNIWGIVNTTHNRLIYKLDSDRLGGSMNGVGGDSVLTLHYDTSGMGDTDDLSITFDIPEYYVSRGVKNFTFSGGNLTQIDYTDGSVDTFTYDVNGDLDTITKTP